MVGPGWQLPHRLHDRGCFPTGEGRNQGRTPSSGGLRTTAKAVRLIVRPETLGWFALRKLRPTPIRRAFHNANQVARSVNGNHRTHNGLFPRVVRASMRAALAALTALLLVAACEGRPAGTANATPSPSALQSPVSARCQLPVGIRRFDPAAHTWSPDTAGFLSFPDGGFIKAYATGVRYDSSRRLWLPAGIPTPDAAGYV
jgi:hypothetical protein